jgi:hypothetical protein
VLIGETSIKIAARGSSPWRTRAFADSTVSFMRDGLVTIATFANPVAANLARNRLEAAGIRCSLSDEETVGMVWHLGNALGRVKLQVRAADAEEARAFLSPDGRAHRPEPGETDEPVGSLRQAEQPPDLPPAEPEEPDPPLSAREQDAERAFRGAVIGLLFWPFQLYVLWLLLKVFVSEEALGPVQRRRARAAAAINLPLMAVFCLAAGALWSA